MLFFKSEKEFIEYGCYNEDKALNWLIGWLGIAIGQLTYIILKA